MPLPVLGQDRVARLRIEGEAKPQAVVIERRSGDQRRRLTAADSLDLFEGDVVRVTERTVVATILHLNGSTVATVRFEQAVIVTIIKNQNTRPVAPGRTQANLDSEFLNAISLIRSREGSDSILEYERHPVLEGELVLVTVRISPNDPTRSNIMRLSPAFGVEGARSTVAGGVGAPPHLGSDPRPDLADCNTPLSSGAATGLTAAAIGLQLQLGLNPFAGANTRCRPRTDQAIREMLLQRAPAGTEAEGGPGVRESPASGSIVRQGVGAPPSAR